MIELSRHIEILLLSNDCVIVPGLGGFMAHHVNARYDESDNYFLPPTRTLGFNPQLKMNDSLLAQSYVEAYDISYPEALRRIEDEVNELTQTIQNEGYYHLNGIGSLSMNSEGHYIFTPCEAGILSPSLYALPSFEFPLRAEKAFEKIHVTEPSDNHIQPKMEPAKNETREAPSAESAEEKPQTVYEKEEEEGNDALVIKMSWIRNAVAVAAAILMFVLMTTPISNSETNLASTNLGTSVIFDTTKKKAAPDPVQYKKAELKTVHDSIRSAITAASDNVVAEQKQEVKDTSYCIVLASHVSQKNANAFVERLHKDGFKEAEVYVRNNVTRVVYGKYLSQNEAYNRLNSIRGNKDFVEAWVLKTTDR